MVKEKCIFIQLLNKNQDWFFLNLSTAEPSWLLPKSARYSAVQFLTHATEDNKYYYENTKTSEVSWVLPSEISKFVQEKARFYASRTRIQLERECNDDFPEEASAALVVAIESYLESSEKEEEGEADEGSDEDGEG